MTDRRVAITGLGVVTAAGIGIEAFWQAVLDGRPCIREISAFDAGKFASRVAGEIEDFSARTFVPKSYRKSVKVMSRDIELAVAGSDLAVRDAGIVTRGVNPDAADIDGGRLGCNIGAGLICTDLDELGAAVNTAVIDGTFDMTAWGRTGLDNLTPLWLLKYLPNMLACHVTIIHGAEGPSNTITCGGASGHLAIGEGSRWIARGAADAVIAGGAESKINPMGLLRQQLLGRLCTERNDRAADACRPFDADHAGTVIGEGAGLLMLEQMQRAQARGARIYAELVGCGASCSPAGIDVTEANAGSLDLAADNALRDAGIGPDDIDLVVAHGTGVAGEDRCEADAWRAALGRRAETVPATALTGAIGSLFAGAGGAELAAAAMALHTQTVPPTVNFAAPAEGCGLNFAAGRREAKLNYVVSGAFAIGGQSGACILKRYEA